MSDPLTIELASDVLNLEPVEVAEVALALAMALSTAASTPSGDVPTISLIEYTWLAMVP